jgi:diadenosine tetraphosphate (Ap4A) HIT family hydrolase
MGNKVPTACEFCNEFSGGSFNSFRKLFSRYDLPSRQLAETSNFVVIAGLGALSEGYILIVSKAHYRSMGYLGKVEFFDELSSLMVEARYVCQDIYGSTFVFFEHGTHSESKRAGGCVDHSHIHGCPLACHQLQSIRDRLARDFDEVRFQRLEFLESVIRSGSPYLLLDVGDDSKFLYRVPDNLPSQYLRRIWASEIGRPDEWDWAVFPGKENIVKTCNQLSGWLDQRFKDNVG